MRNGSVQRKVCQMLASLHDDLLGSVNEELSWTVRETTTIGGQAGGDSVASIPPPPGLEMQPIQEDHRRTTSDDEPLDMDTPCPNALKHSACEGTPVKQSARTNQNHDTSRGKTQPGVSRCTWY